MIRAWAREVADKARARTARRKGKGAEKMHSSGPKCCVAFRNMRIRKREEEPEAWG
jgi:hypothetical protein